MNRSPPSPAQALSEILAAAAAWLDSGQPRQALAALKSRGSIALGNPVGQNILGEIRLALGEPRDALGAFDTALRLTPTFAEAHANRGAALIDLGRLAEALDAQRQALAIKPGLPIAYFNSGLILSALNRPEEAVAAFGAVLDQRPDHVEALIHRGRARLEADQPLEALTDFRGAGRLAPRLGAARLGAAEAYAILGLPDAALAALGEALTLDPGNADVPALRAKLAAGLAASGAATKAGPVPAVPRRLRAYALALEAADASIRNTPADAEGYVRKARALSELGDLEGASAALATAERLGAASASYHHMRALLLTDLGDLAEAEASHRRAVELEPEETEFRYHHGMLRLAMGDFPAGWRDFEWRLKNPQYREFQEQTRIPRWQGEALAGKRILLLNEQGNGDTIQFARFVPVVAALGASVTLLVVPPLVSLLARSLPDVAAVSAIRRDAHFDYQIPLMSLPFALGIRLADLPGPGPYLSADRTRIEKWRARLRAGGLKVGVAWQGHPDYYRDRYRSIPLARFAPLSAVEGVRLISVQAAHGLRQLAALPPGMKVENYGADIGANPEGFEEIAALMANLDLIVTSDTVTAHLAGALGRPTWIALRDRPDWRWMYDRSDSPWYPTMRLFRQRQRGDWAGVFTEIAGALAKEAALRLA